LNANWEGNSDLLIFFALNAFNTWRNSTSPAKPSKKVQKLSNIEYCSIFYQSKIYGVITAITRHNPPHNKGIIFPVQFMRMAVHATMEYVMPSISSNFTATELLHCPSRSLLET
jgi:hypothetical protein